MELRPPNILVEPTRHRPVIVSPRRAAHLAGKVPITPIWRPNPWFGFRSLQDYSGVALAFKRLSPRPPDAAAGMTRRGRGSRRGGRHTRHRDAWPSGAIRRRSRVARSRWRGLR